MLLVKKGNPWKIKDWGDIVKPGIGIITPNPKPPAARAGTIWRVLLGAEAAGGTPASAQAFLTKLYKNVPVLDTGARASTLTFAQRGIGDVALSWENEAHLASEEFGDKFDIVFPSISILAEPPVTVVDKNVDRHHTVRWPRAYLKFLYTPAAQEIIAKNYYRPRDPAVLAKYKANFPSLNLVTIDDPAFGGWKKAQATHFADGGLFDKIYAPGVR